MLLPVISGVLSPGRRTPEKTTCPSAVISSHVLLVVAAKRNVSCPATGETTAEGVDGVDADGVTGVTVDGCDTTDGEATDGEMLEGEATEGVGVIVDNGCASKTIATVRTTTAARMYRNGPRFRL